MRRAPHRRMTGGTLGMAALLGALGGVPVAQAQVDLFPADALDCGGTGCDLEYGETSGDAAVDLALGRARSRSEGGNLVDPDSDRAEVGLLFRACGAAMAEVTVHAAFFGLLRGSGAGAANLARFEIHAFLRDETTDEDVASSLIVSQIESGGFLQTVNTLVDSTFTDPNATLNAPLEANHTYAAGIRLITETQGVLPVPARADFRSGNRRAELTAVELTLTPSMADSDGDGLFDEWETAGVKDCDGDVVLDLASLGATPDHKDILVELDWLPGAEPEPDELDAVKVAFAAAPLGAGGTANPDGEPGIRLRIDTGGLRRPDAREDGAAGALGEFSCFDGIDNGSDWRADDQDSDCVVGDNLGGGSEIELADLPNGKNVPRLVGDADGNGEPDFFEVKAEEFDLAARRLVFHYAIGGLPGDEEGDGGPGSCADALDNDGDGSVDDDDTDDCFSTRSQGSPGISSCSAAKGARSCTSSATAWASSTAATRRTTASPTTSAS
jgi:hypothetical protein